MRVLVLVKATADSENAAPPDAASMRAMGKFNVELHEAGILVLAEGLKPTLHARRVAFDGADRTVIDGPFANTNELIAGFWLWDVKDLDEAIAWVKRCPNPMRGPSEIEIRPLFEMAEIEALLPPEAIKARADRARRWKALSPKPAGPARD